MVANAEAPELILLPGEGFHLFSEIADQRFKGLAASFVLMV